MSPASSTVPGRPPSRYVPRGPTTLTRIFHDHFPAFTESYDEFYAKDCGRCPPSTDLPRRGEIRNLRGLLQGHRPLGHCTARIQCSNPDCRFEYFRPFSCKGFYLCPSCCQKRALLFADYLDEQLLLELPHRQLVFSIPKALRIFFRHDQKLFGSVSSLTRFYRLAAGSPALRSAAIVAFQI